MVVCRLRLGEQVQDALDPVPLLFVQAGGVGEQSSPLVEDACKKGGIGLSRAACADTVLPATHGQGCFGPACRLKLPRGWGGLFICRCAGQGGGRRSLSASLQVLATGCSGLRLGSRRGGFGGGDLVVDHGFLALCRPAPRLG